MNKGGAKAPPLIMRGSLEVSPLFYGEEAKVPRFLRGSDGELPAFLRGSGDGNAERGVIFASKFGNIYQKIHIERRKNYALC